MLFTSPAVRPNVLLLSAFGSLLEKCFLFETKSPMKITLVLGMVMCPSKIF